MDRSNNRNQRISEIEARLSELEGERKRLVVELTTLQSSTRSPDELPALMGLPALPSPPQTPDEKVDLFLSLFRARESVFPKLWENPSKGRKGYSPACRNEWARGICGKPQTKCSDCPNQAFPPLDAQAIRDHLQGKCTIGTYALRENDTCTFLAADFDGDGCRTIAANCASGTGNDSVPTPSTSTFGIGISSAPLTKKSPCRFTPDSTVSSGLKSWLYSISMNFIGTVAAGYPGKSA